VLTDFGSTYTKVTLVDLESGGLVAHAQAPTTVTTDVMDGFSRALDQAQAVADTAQAVVLGPRISASSAGGGLRVAAVGLVGDLTAAAARRAALNAGGRVDLVLSGSLGAGDADALRAATPDIVLFCGGTDGGQRDRVLRNAEVIAESGATAEVVVACNREIAEEVTARFDRAGLRTQTVENTMPRVGELNIEPARAAILQAFLAHVIRGKGLSVSPEFTDSVVTATPDAVLRGVELLASGIGAQSGLGSVAVVDVGGATTDVHSHVDLSSSPAIGAMTPLLPVLPTIRTVQGDLGMRSSAGGVLAADRLWLGLELGDELEPGIIAREAQIDLLPVDDLDVQVDRALATSCVTHALRRHCGRQYWAFRRNEPARATRTGPDLRAIDLLIGTGGVLTRGEHGAQILEDGLRRVQEDHCLMAPAAPRIVVDRHYILAAAGLLATRDPDLALRFMAQEFAYALEDRVSTATGT
jgi:uncharacterized protein (TIGR01319 family)